MKAAVPLAFLFCVFFAPNAMALFDRNGEHIVVSGGPALREWENYRVESQRHDRWWGNFVRAARVKMQQIRKEEGPNARITWLVYRRAYEGRGKEDQTDYVSNVISVRDRDDVKCKLIWFNTKEALINYLNSGMDRSQFKIKSFDFFGHSNKYCFAFDYSGEILGASKCYLHQNDLKLINRGAFARGAECKSWGCHTGEAMSKVWRSTLGVKLRGAVGKTDYAYCWQNGGTLPVVSPGGRWTY